LSAFAASHEIDKAPHRRRAVVRHAPAKLKRRLPLALARRARFLAGQMGRDARRHAGRGLLPGMFSRRNGAAFSRLEAFLAFFRETDFVFVRETAFVFFRGVFFALIELLSLTLAIRPEGGS